MPLKVSVILPVRNCIKYLSLAMDSIINQTFKDFELIVINGNSTDGSLELLEQYAKNDNRVKIINQKSQGISRALNEGIEASSGELIARMDADDICDLTRLEKQVDYFSKNPDTDILGTKIKTIGDTDNEVTRIYDVFLNQDIKEGDDLMERFLHGCALCHPSVMMKRSFLEDIGGYDEKLNNSEDYQLWLRALRNNKKIRIYDEVLFYYRIHNESGTIMERNSNRQTYLTELIKMDAIKDILQKCRKMAIWGASKGGELVYSIVKDNFPNIQVNSFIDTFKEGELFDIKIEKPEKIKDIDFDFIYIATMPGRDYAVNYLDQLGLNKIYEYI